MARVERFYLILEVNNHRLDIYTEPKANKLQKIADSSGVTTISEGLTLVIITWWALRTCQMAGKNALVRSLPSVKTLVSCCIIGSDRTETWTTNLVSVQRPFGIGKSRIEPDKITIN